ncbi:DUF1775 domain-containing protein [Kitasatospora cheerisanensis]|uniref:YncI copper-binding domain-containing protein n=1 Tax=Kitasatospora cheerisanensis KCTC 2395 TaxID=1348663 RepID=A0A066Z8N9_9ACTN|nr:DUF1775 domain-containing protein [Kitasatospora cheerisanensis]KDN86545.1 hypothetical protein KCH_16410 [Kitasatospora cheerisanensis KCTC 2395]
MKTPDGWTYTATADGWTVAGPALAPGAAAEYSVKLRQLPATTSVVFKTLVDYSDGHTDRWIEIPQGDSKPEHPAPSSRCAPPRPARPRCPPRRRRAPPPPPRPRRASPPPSP